MKHPYGIGLDIGIASVGWAVVALNENAEPYGLVRCGSRIFDKAEQPKTGDSLAAPRREARSARRRLRRRSLRKADLYELMEKNGLPGKAEIEQAVQAGHLCLCAACSGVGWPGDSTGFCPYTAAPDAAQGLSQ